MRSPSRKHRVYIGQHNEVTICSFFDFINAIPRKPAQLDHPWVTTVYQSERPQYGQCCFNEERESPLISVPLDRRISEVATVPDTLRNYWHQAFWKDRKYHNVNMEKACLRRGPLFAMGAHEFLVHSACPGPIHAFRVGARRWAFDMPESYSILISQDNQRFALVPVRETLVIIEVARA